MFKHLLLIGLCAPLLARADDTVTMQRVEVNAVRDAEWASYRHAYKTAAFFATFTRTRPLIQAQMQIRPLAPAASLEGLMLHLAGDTTQLDIAVDAIGRATIPFNKTAYDEDAVLRLNRQKGLYYFSGRYSIRERDDGVYSVATLRAACEQLIDAQRASGYRLRLLGKRCVGVRFSYRAGDDAANVELHGADGAVQPVVVVDGYPFEDESMGLYKVAVLRFADLPAEASVVTRARPLAIGTVYD